MKLSKVASLALFLLLIMPGKEVYSVDKDEVKKHQVELIDQPIAEEKRCLADAIYFEARSEGEKGKVAVAMTVINRTKTGKYPGSICEVIKQKETTKKGKKICQFSWMCDRKLVALVKNREHEKDKEFQKIMKIVDDIKAGKVVDITKGSTHFHALYVSPGWKLKRVAVIGSHVFYKG